jgi:ParB family chromosome partitioning protein
MPAAVKQAPRLKNLDELFRLNDGVNPIDAPATQKAPSVSAGSEYGAISFSLMDDFPGHPFRLYGGERESDMVDSIRAKGILQPLILRAMNNGRYQVLSGHNRKYCGMKAGLTECPAIIKRNLPDEDAWMYVIETNLMQRSFADMAHSEKAAIIATQHSKLFSQGKRSDILAELQRLEKPHEHNESGTFAQLAQKSHSNRKIAEMYSLSKDTVARYLRINKLIIALKTRLDNGELAFLSAVTLSFLKEAEQDMLEHCMTLNRFSADMKKADMKKITVSLILAYLLASFTVTAAAAVPDDVVAENRNGRQIIVKTYTLKADEDPEHLIEDPFEREGFSYAFDSVAKAATTTGST